MSIRKEVNEFVRASEVLLSPILLGQPLNEDERELVSMCLESLAKEYSVKAPQASGTNGRHRFRDSWESLDRRW